MARRGRAIDVAFVVEAFFRVAGAIVFDTLAFVIWNVGTRSPASLVRDVGDALRTRRALATGLLWMLVGAIFLTAGTILLLPAIVDPPVDFAPTELFAFIVALALEHIVGNDLRALIALPGKRI